MNKGKSGSYRCISVCLPKENKIFLDTIYPKTGSDGHDNLTKEAYKDCAKRVNEAIAKKAWDWKVQGLKNEEIIEKLQAFLIFLPASFKTILRSPLERTIS